jgi:hypothetical protein
MADRPRVSLRVQEHVKELREAGLNTEAFFNALVGIRDDSALPSKHRDAIYRLVAMECYVWYLDAIRGERIDRFKLMQEARAIAEKNQAAIKKRTPGDSSAELVTKDIVQKPGAPITRPPKLPEQTATVRERMPKVAERHASKPASEPRSGRTPQKKK